MLWFSELREMGWLVIFWIATAVVLSGLSWLLTRNARGTAQSDQRRTRPFPRPSTPRPST